MAGLLERWELLSPEEPAKALGTGQRRGCRADVPHPRSHVKQQRKGVEHKRVVAASHEAARGRGQGRGAARPFCPGGCRAGAAGAGYLLQGGACAVQASAERHSVSTATHRSLRSSWTAQVCALAAMASTELAPPAGCCPAVATPALIAPSPAPLPAGRSELASLTSPCSKRGGLKS